MKMYIKKVAIISCVTVTICNSVFGVPISNKIEKLDVLNNFRAIMNGINSIVNYIPKLSAIAVPLIGNPNAKPKAIEGEIAKQQKVLDERFKPINAKLGTLKKIEADQPWLLKMACLEGSKTIIDDVNNIKSILDATLATLRDNLTTINKLASSPELDKLKKTIETNDAVKKALIQVAQIHPEVLKAAQQAGAVPATVPVAAAAPQPAQVPYNRSLSIRNMGKSEVKLKQIHIPENGKSMREEEVKTVDGKRFYDYGTLRPGESPHSWSHVSNGPIDMEFTYTGTTVTANIPAGEEKTMCIDVNEQGAKEISCEAQATTYTRTLKINNAGKTAALGRQINISGPDMLGLNQPNRKAVKDEKGLLKESSQEFDVLKELKPNEPQTLEKVSAGPIDLEFQFYDTTGKVLTDKKASGSLPGVAPKVKTCVQFDETGVKVIEGGWCDDTYKRTLNILNMGMARVELKQINIPENSNDLLNRPVKTESGKREVALEGIEKNSSLNKENVTNGPFTLEFSYSFPNKGTIKLPIPAGYTPMCVDVIVDVTHGEAKIVDCQRKYLTDTGE